MTEQSLGTKPTAQPTKTLETFENPNKARDFHIHMEIPEFTCLCPKTGQPDFAHIVVDYVPDQFLVESKSFKLFMASFRNHGAFHEDCTLLVAKRLIACMQPKWLRIGGYWYPRGGIPIDVFWQTSEPPVGLFIPDQGVPPYRGR